jgi:hypothetical protein
MEYRYDNIYGEHVFGNIDIYFEDNRIYSKLQELMGIPIDIYIERVNKLVKNLIITDIAIRHEGLVADHMMLSFSFTVTGLEHYDPMLEDIGNG